MNRAALRRVPPALCLVGTSLCGFRQERAGASCAASDDRDAPPPPPTSLPLRRAPLLCVDEAGPSPHLAGWNVPERRRASFRDPFWAKQARREGGRCA
jgi:hypothetical protein